MHQKQKQQILQGLYVVDTTSQTYVEECINWQEKPTLIVSIHKIRVTERSALFYELQIWTDQRSLPSAGEILSV